MTTTPTRHLDCTCCPFVAKRSAPWAPRYRLTEVVLVGPAPAPEERELRPYGVAFWPPEGLRRITLLLGRYLLQGLGQRSFRGMVPGAHVCVWKLWMGSGHVLARYTGQWKGNFRDGRDPSGCRILSSTLLCRDMSCRPTWPKLRPRYHVFCM